MFAAGDPLPVACAQADLGLPPAVLERLGPLRQAQVQRPTDCGRVARGSGPCEQGPARLGMPFAPQKNAHPALHVDDVAAARAELEAKGVEFFGDIVDSGLTL